MRNGKRVRFIEAPLIVVNSQEFGTQDVHPPFGLQSGMKFVESGNLERDWARSLRFGGSPLGVVVNPLSRQPILSPHGRATDEEIYPRCQT